MSYKTFIENIKEKENETMSSIKPEFLGLLFYERKSKRKAFFSYNGTIKKLKKILL